MITLHGECTSYWIPLRRVGGAGAWGGGALASRLGTDA